MTSQLIIMGLLVVPTVIGEVICPLRLDVVSAAAWSALPSSYFGCDLLGEADLVAVGFTDGSTHAVLHYGRNETFLRGWSHNFHLYGADMTRELEEMRGLQVKDVGLGFKFIAILTHDGAVWTAGVNNYGQLGHHGNRNRPVFSPVEGLPAVRQMAVGSHHCVVLTEDGQLLSWGYNDRQQLGRPTDSLVNPSPMPVTLTQGAALPKDLCCGWDQCTVLTEDSVVFTWGNIDRIGRPQGDGTPGIVQWPLDNQTIAQISCGVFHTLALTEDGDLYGWGYNGYGELLTAPSNAPRATKLDLGERIVREVVAGNYLTVIRTYSSVGEFFGNYGGAFYRAPEMATRVDYIRDLMSRSFYGQETRGAVRLGCPAEGRQSCHDDGEGGAD